MASPRPSVARPRRPAATASAPCACAAGERKAIAVDPDIKTRNRNRLRRIEGQVRGLQRMVEDDRYCADILVQISSVEEALRAVARELLRNHLRHCVRDAVEKGPDQAERAYEELVQLFDRHS